MQTTENEDTAKQIQFASWSSRWSYYSAELVEAMGLIGATHLIYK